MNTRRHRLTLASVVMVGGLLLTGCQVAVGTGAAAEAGAGEIIDTTTAAGPARAAPGPVVTGRGWTAAGLEGPVPQPNTCHLHVAAGGEPVPDPTCTPGAVDHAVTAANIGDTICRKGGYTSSVRPPESITQRAKKQIMAAYGIPWNQASTYELDHLVELNAGGSSDYRNLWPEPNTLHTATASAYVHNDKDAVEAYTYHAICSRKVLFTAVQNDISSNWSTTVAELGLPAIPAGYRG